MLANMRTRLRDGSCLALKTETYSRKKLISGPKINVSRGYKNKTSLRKCGVIEFQQDTL